MPDCCHLAQAGRPADQEGEPAGLRERTGQPGWQMPLKEHGSGPPQLGICARVRLTWHMRTAADSLPDTFLGTHSNLCSVVRLLRQLFMLVLHPALLVRQVAVKLLQS